MATTGIELSLDCETAKVLGSYIIVKKLAMEQSERLDIFRWQVH